MAIHNSSDLVYKSFKKLDTYVLACIWSICLFTFLILTGEYFLYEYLKPKLMEKDLFLYFFCATLLFYFFIILAAFYILSKVGDYKTQESTISDSVIDTETPKLQEDHFENAIHKNVSNQNGLCETNSHVIDQQNQDISQICPSLSEACLKSCFNSILTTVGNTVKEMNRNPNYAKKFSKRTSEGDKHYENMKRVLEQDLHLLIENFIETYEFKKTNQDTKLFPDHQLLRTYTKNHVFNISETKQKVEKTVDCDTLKKPGVNVAETSFAMPAKKLANHSHFDVMSPSNQTQLNGIIVPEIIIEDVDGENPMRYNLEFHRSFKNEKMLQPSTKKSIVAPEDTMKNVTCFKYDTCRPVQTSYNIVGLPEPVRTFNEINHDKNSSDCLVPLKKKITDNSNNQRHIQDKCIPQTEKYFYGESRKHALQKPNHINAVKITPEEIF